MTDDRNLSVADVQALATKDGVAAFFAAMGYRTDSRQPQSVSAMGITAGSLSRQINHIERIAVHDDGAESLDTYLMELTSVTMAAIQGLVRVLRNRAGNYLLVLTDDYERLDFVLLQRTLPGTPTLPMTVSQVAVRPRILTISRRNPTQVQLRVLRRFTYTELDSDAQYDKLLSAYTVAEWSEPHFNNRALFSDYYLNERLPELPEWKERPEETYRRLRELLPRLQLKINSTGDSTTVQASVESAIEILGFKAVKTSEENGPDYRLYAPDNLEKPVAVCLAYAWNRYLDGRDETRDVQTPDENPGARVVTVLESCEVPWAIVTNGKLWRLYSARTHSRSTNYYEIDLDETLAMADPNESFRYFWLFFRQNAFVANEIRQDGQIKVSSFLDRLLEESERYAKALGVRLKERVFEQVFPHFARGFIEHMKSQGGVTSPRQASLLSISEQLALKPEPDEEFCRQVFNGTLTLLYRLLFLLYAEARDLLPVKEVRGYWDQSLTKLKDDIAEKAGSIADAVPERLGKAYRVSVDATELYDRLLELFSVISLGSRDLNVPLYSGGLFIAKPDDDDHTQEAETARFLASYKIPDRYLALGLDLLARDLDEKRQDLVFMDYKSLGVRQLGSIYEGLLELRVCIAQEKMAVIKGSGKTEKVIPYQEAIKSKRRVLTIGRGRNAQERVYQPGDVYLENDRRERKTTGSYYTPDHIVKHIVENTVGPVLTVKFSKLRQKFRDAQQSYRNALNRAGALGKQGMKSDDLVMVANRYADLVDDLFDLKVLDPAMGSGHFLVEAVDFICDQILGEREGFLRSFPWNPVTKFLQDTRETIVTEMERQGVAVDTGRLTDINLLKRHVLKRCAYGVDLNPMAVELAKVSLWLDCFTIGAPLSFLDHHLKCGNSLIGTTVQRIESELAKQTQGHVGTLFGGPFQGLLSATASIEQLRRIPDATVEEAERSHSLYTDFETAQAPYKSALDIWVSHHFGNAKAKAYLTLAGPNLVDQIRSGGENLSPDCKEAIAQGVRIGTEMQFFHWDLEFPEAFVDLAGGQWKNKETQGFDAVVGNPPWGAEFTDTTLPFVRLMYQSATKGVVDNFAIFLEAAHRLGNSGGHCGLLLPDIFLLKNYPAIRKYILENNRIDEIVHWGMPFPEANIDVCSITFSKVTTSNEHLVRCIPEVTGASSQTLKVNEIPQSRFLEQIDYRMNLALTENLHRALNAVTELGPRFGDLFTIREGIHSGNVRTKLFPMDQPSNDGHPLLFGRDEIRPLKITWSGRWVHYDESIINKEIGEYANLGNPALHRALKILVRRTGDTVIAALDDQGYFVSNNLFLCVPSAISDEYLWFCLALLNSQFATWFFRSINPRVGRLFAELKINHLKGVPVVFLDDSRYGSWIKDVNNSVRELLVMERTDEDIRKYMNNFDMCLWERLVEEVPEMAAYQDVVE